MLGYYSWGSNDPAIKIRRFDFTFVPGALAGMFVSSDGRTFKEPPADWKIGAPGQSLAGDLIREGVSGIAGHVSEPYLEATIRPNILFPAYLSGFNLIESYYMAMPYLSWQTVVIGDPLCAPFRTKSLPAAEIDKGIDPEIELPAYFGSRRLKVLSAAAHKQAGVLPETVKAIIRAEALMARKDQDGALRALEEAVARDDRLPLAQMLLAGLYEAAKEYDKAIARYRIMLQKSPEDAVALNNLAYALAVRKNNVEEALPLAEKAYRLSKGHPSIGDTLGWIYHLAGQKDQAVRYLQEAAQKGSPSAAQHLKELATDSTK